MSEPFPKYRTFIRSCTNWRTFAKGRKMTQDRGLTYSDARDRCEEYNKNRNARQIRKGTMMEFEAE